MLEHLYTDTGDIKRPTEATTATRQVKRTFAVIASGVSCEFQPLSGGYPLGAKGFVKDSTHQGFFESSVDIVRGDRFTHDGTDYDVVDVQELRGGHHLEVYFEEVHE